VKTTPMAMAPTMARKIKRVAKKVSMKLQNSAPRPLAEMASAVSTAREAVVVKPRMRREGARGQGWDIPEGRLLLR
jgi:hypothetical protein